LKANNKGSLEVLEEVVSRLPTDELTVKPIKKILGAINYSDIDFAFYTEPKAIVIGYGVDISRVVKSKAVQMGITINSFGVIYNVLDYLNRILADKLPPDELIEIRGRATIQEVFKLKQKDKSLLNVAGCLVTSGKIIRGSDVRIIRNDEIVWEGKIRQLKQHREDAKEINSGHECGAMFSDDFQNFATSDIIESFDRKIIPRQSFVKEEDYEYILSSTPSDELLLKTM